MDAKIIATHMVEDAPPHIRLQEYAVGIFDEVPTKSSLKKAIKKQRILVNGKVATTANFIYKKDVIELLSQEQIMSRLYKINLKVHYQDDYLAVIEKPAGISVSGNKLATIQNALQPYITQSSQFDATLPHPVHRLDYATSGNLIIGKTATARRHMHEMFAENQVHKTYHAVTVGAMSNRTGSITLPLEGKKALTHYHVLQSIASKKFEALNLVRLTPITGRMHQLRRHLLSIGNPIMGDKKYYVEDKQHKGYGLYLHASGLKFNHPMTNEKIEMSSPLPKKFQRLFPAQ